MGKSEANDPWETESDDSLKEDIKPENDPWKTAEPWEVQKKR